VKSEGYRAGSPAVYYTGHFQAKGQYLAGDGGDYDLRRLALWQASGIGS
jgi:hypothetical protein